MTREEYINTLELDIAELREEIKTKDKAYKAIVEELTECAEENEKLKSQLAGTTHCFDEEEHRELKKQLEKCYCNRADCSSRIKDSKKYDSLVQTQETQEKAFIKYLEDMLDDENDMFSVVKVKDVLQKYKEIIKN